MINCMMAIDKEIFDSLDLGKGLFWLDYVNFDIVDGCVMESMMIDAGYSDFEVFEKEVLEYDKQYFKRLYDLDKYLYEYYEDNDKYSIDWLEVGDKVVLSVVEYV